MSDFRLQQGHWWQPQGWLSGECRFDDRVHAIDAIEQVPEHYFIPAPVDLHVHGGGGSDCMQGVDAIRQTLRTHALGGAGSLLATSVTAPVNEIDQFLDNVNRVMSDQKDDEARLLGAHLEGPFINPDKLGAQPPHTIPIDLAVLQRWLDHGCVRVITVAPELAGADELIKLCQQYQVRVQIGHTLCSWQRALEVIRAGCGVTHLFNAMSVVSHRDGGAATAVLAAADYAEIITDSHHVDRMAFELARRAIPRLYSVTDATAASGMPDGEYRLGDLQVIKQGDCVRLPGGSLAGSCLTQLESIAVLRNWGLSWHEIGLRCSYYPACWLGLGQDEVGQVGLIASGSSADWLEIQHDVIVAHWQCGVRREI